VDFLVYMLSPILSAFAPVVLMTQSGGSGSGGFVSLLLPLLLIGLVFYFFIYKPQKDREKEHDEMVANLEQGDKIVTIGGIHGTVQRIDDDSILAQVDSKGTKLRIDKQAIANLKGDDDA
jgi:preprotein translocase subunit YajC